MQTKAQAGWMVCFASDSTPAPETVWQPTKPVGGAQAGAGAMPSTARAEVGVLNSAVEGTDVLGREHEIATAAEGTS
jgi:hypothetical protein